MSRCGFRICFNDTYSSLLSSRTIRSKSTTACTVYLNTPRADRVT